MDTGKTYVGVPEIKQLLGIGKKAAYSLMKQKGFPAIKVGRAYKVSVVALEKWLAKQARKGLGA